MDVAARIFEYVAVVDRPNPNLSPTPNPNLTSVITLTRILKSYGNPKPKDSE